MRHEASTAALCKRQESLTVQEIVITKDTTLERSEIVGTRIVIRANNITVDGGGAVLVGPGQKGDLASFESAGTAIVADGCVNVTLKNLSARGFESGLKLTDCSGWIVEKCDFSDNYHNPEFGWGELPPRGGIILNRVRTSVFRRNRASNVWDALNMVDSDDNEFIENDFSHCSNVCAKLWTSSRNRFIKNDLSWGLRIDRSIGEVHARDSTGVLIESGSNDNYWRENDITYGGDGVFIRVLNGWISTGNVFIENDTSYANNNCVECWSPRNVFIRNKANHGSYGFWMGGSDQSVLIGNEAGYNGQPDEHQNAPVSDLMGFAGIIFACGPGSHCIIEGNYCHHNGSGIVFQGDRKSEGEKWKIYHWIVQNNRLEHNRRAIYAEHADWVFIGQNKCSNNAEEDYIRNVTRLTRGEDSPGNVAAPVVKLTGPELISVNTPVTFDASASYDPQGRALKYEWDLGECTSDQPAITHSFTKPGFYRVGLTVTNGTLSSLGWRDLVVTETTVDEMGTELSAEEWGFEATGDNEIIFENDADSVIGRYSLKFSPRICDGEMATAVYPKTQDAGWDLSDRRNLVFWFKANNPNIPVEGSEDGAVSLTLAGEGGELKFTGFDCRIMPGGLYSEARWTWYRVEIPLAGDDAWKLEKTGDVNMKCVNAICFAVKTPGVMPYTIWIDGLRFE